MSEFLRVLLPNPHPDSPRLRPSNHPVLDASPLPLSSPNPKAAAGPSGRAQLILPASQDPHLSSSKVGAHGLTHLGGGEVRGDADMWGFQKEEGRRIWLEGMGGSSSELGLQD